MGIAIKFKHREVWATILTIREIIVSDSSDYHAMSRLSRDDSDITGQVENPDFSDLSDLWYFDAWLFPSSTSRLFIDRMNRWN